MRTCLYLTLMKYILDDVDIMYWKIVLAVRLLRTTNPDLVIPLQKRAYSNV